jgi:hypothetical protein
VTIRCAACGFPLRDGGFSCVACSSGLMHGRCIEAHRCSAPCVELTDSEHLALETLAKLRADKHQAGCQCRPCSESRAVWVGDLDELERLLAETLAAREVKR